MSDSQFLIVSSVGIGEPLTRYINVAGDLKAETTEAVVETPVRDAGVFSNLFVYVSANNVNTSTVITFRKSQAGTTLTVSYGLNETGIKEDTTNTVTVAATDEIDYQVVTPATVGNKTITIKVMGMKFTPTTSTNCVSILAMAGSQVFNTASTTRFCVPNGPNTGGFTTTEDNVKYRIRGTFTSSDFYVYANGNSRTTNTVFGTRKNGAPGGQSVTYAGAETGAKEDTTGTDSLIAGDDFNYFITTLTGAENIFPTILSSSLISIANQFILLCTAGSTGVSVAFNVTTYLGCAGNLAADTTEINRQIYPRFTFTAKELGVYVSANTIATSATTATLMDNGSPSAITVSYAAAETGLKLDSVNTTEITTITDEIDYRVVTPNTSGSITFRWMGILGDTSAGGTPYTRSITGTVNLTAVNTFLYTGLRSIADTENLTSTITNVSSMVRTLADTEELNSAVTRIVIKVADLSATENLSEAVTTIASKIRTIADTEELGEAISRLYTGQRSIADTEELNSVITKVLTGVRTLADTEQLSSTIQKTLVKFVDLTATENVSEAITLIASQVRTLAETLNLTESLTKLYTGQRSITDIEQLIDSQQTAVTFIRLLTSTENLSSIEAIVKTKIIAIAESLNLSSAIVTQLTQVTAVIFGENLALLSVTIPLGLLTSTQIKALISATTARELKG